MSLEALNVSLLQQAGLTFVPRSSPMPPGSPTVRRPKSRDFMARQGGFCLQVAEALVNEQETCHTGAVLLCLSERINLCLSLPPLRGLPSTASPVPQSARSSIIPSSGLHPPHILSMRCFVHVIYYYFYKFYYY